MTAVHKRRINRNPPSECTRKSARRTLFLCTKRLSRLRKKSRITRVVYKNRYRNYWYGHLTFGIWPCVPVANVTGDVLTTITFESQPPRSISVEIFNVLCAFNIFRRRRRYNFN